MKKFVSATNVKVSNNISEDIAFSILSKLPLKSLKRFGCVHESWALLFENLYFMSMYQNYFLSKNHSYYDGTSILLNWTNNALPGEIYHSTLYLLSGERFESMDKLDLPPPFHEDDCFIDVLSKTSVNGTLCLAQDFLHVKCVFWNPTTYEFKVIPSSPFLSQSHYMTPLVIFHGFGYEHVRDDYMVIRYLIFYETDTDEPRKEDYLYLDPMWEIYSLRSNSWRKLDIKMPSSCANEKLYTDGMCHWWSRSDDNNSRDEEPPRLVSFDLYNEVFLTTNLPSDILERYDMLYLTLLNGSIAFIIYDETTTFHIRILGELGVKESWAIIFILDPLPSIEHPIGAGKKGDIFFRKDDDELVWFDMSTRMIKKLGVKGYRHNCHIIIYKGSLIPIGG